MKNLLVTGGTRGLGLAIAGRLSDQGYHVIATGRQPSAELEALAKRGGRGRVTFAQLDLGLPDGIHDFVRQTTARHGHLYGLVNNAALGYGGVLATMHDSQIEELLRVNLQAAILLAKYACRSMLVQRQGRIVNIASIIASTGFNGLSVYAATKSALVGFTRSLAREVGKAGITVNSISPGYMETGMTAGLAPDKLAAIRRRSPLNKLVTPEDVAEAVMFLLSDAAAVVTGIDITVDAGSTA